MAANLILPTLPTLKSSIYRRASMLSESNFYSLTGFFRKNFTTSQISALSEQLFGLLSEGLFVLDEKLCYVSVSEKFLQITRLPREEVLGKLFSFHPIDFYPPYYQIVFNEIEEKLQRFQPVDKLVSFENRGGKSILGRLRIHAVQLDEVLVYVGSLVDVNHQYEIRQDIENLLQYDPLTHLPTLSNFVDSLQIAIKVSEQNKDPNRQLLVIRLNIDRLQAFNESIGIQATDELLKLFVQRINVLTPPKHCRLIMFSRFGGDNFGIFLEVDELAAAYRYLDQLSQLFEMPFFIANYPYIYVRVSVGVSLYPRDSTSAESLITQAETALKQARLIGGDDIVWYEKSHRNTLFQDTHLSSAFNRALQDAQIVPFFQPKKLLADPDKPMFEALVRWQHPILGTLTPQDFLDDVIQGMSQQLFETIINLSVSQLVYWKSMGYQCVVCINIDARQLTTERFLQFIFKLLDTYPCLCEHIELELTEIARLIDKPKAFNALQKLRDAGINLAIDDFGKGYSSLSYLAEYPISMIKIDKLFIQDMLQQPKKQALVKSMVNLAHELNIQVIAEGVETQAQYDFLQAINCDGIQGYFYGKPMSAQQATDWLQANFVANPSLAQDFNARYAQTNMKVVP